MTARLRWSAPLAVALAAGAAAACRESPTAPFAAASAVTVGLDTIDFGGSGNPWGSGWLGATVLVTPDRHVGVLAWDGWNGLLRYHECAGACGDPAGWTAGTAAVGLQPSRQDIVGNAVLTATGVHFVYSDGVAIHYLSCLGDCDVAANWAGTDLFAGRGQLGIGEATPLAADPSGRIHLLFFDPSDSTLRYAACAAGCQNASSWHDVQVDTARVDPRTWLIAAAANGTAHAFYQTNAGWMHAACSAGCSFAGSWRSELIANDTSSGLVATASLAFDADGRLHLAYARYGGQVRYATCASPCTPPGQWSVTSLADRAYDLSLAADPQGQLVLASSWNAVTLTTCAADCLDPAHWHSSELGAALGYGSVSLVIDGPGRALVASTYGGFPTILQYSQTQ